MSQCGKGRWSAAAWCSLLWPGSPRLGGRAVSRLPVWVRESLACSTPLLLPVQVSSGSASLSHKEFPGFAPSSPGSALSGKQVPSTLLWPQCPGPLPSSPLCSAPPASMSEVRNGSFKHQPCWLQKEGIPLPSLPPS